MEDIANVVKQVLGSEQRVLEAEERTQEVMEQLRVKQEQYAEAEQVYDRIERHSGRLERQNRRLRRTITMMAEWANEAYDLAHEVDERGSHLRDDPHSLDGARSSMATQIANLMVETAGEPGAAFEWDEEETDFESSGEDDSQEAWQRRVTRRSWTPPPEETDMETEDTE